MQITNMQISLPSGGRLGNQLFQIASTMGIGAKNNICAAFPLWKNNKFFKTSLPGVAPGPGIVIEEHTFEYNPVVITDPTKFVFLNGYFQSEKYFADIKQQIRDTFEFKEEYVIPVKTVLDEANLGTTCSIHVRRGDYLNYPDIHPQQPEDYWHKAQLVIEKNNNINTYIVFSDDITWCINNKQLFNKTGKRVVFMQGRTDMDDFIAMTLCHHNIITNSTFSWWGAWLNKNTNKVVVMPKLWFGPKHPSNAQDVQAEGWIKL